MDNYDDDFDEEIIDESIENEPTDKSKQQKNKARASALGSQQDVKAQPGQGSMKDTDRKSRNGVRKTVALTKPPTKRGSEDPYAAPLKNITNNNKNKNSNSYNDDDIEDEVSPPKRLTAVKSESPKATKNKMQRIKEFDLDAMGIKASMDKRSSHSTPRSRVSQVINFNYYDRFKDIVEGDIYGKSIKEIEAENSKLRDSLRDLNEQLSKIIERARVATLAPKVVEFKNKHFDDKIRTIEKEMNNNKQILEFTVTEYNSLKSKLDKIKNATYVLELEDKIKEAIAKTENLKKENKNLSLAAGNVAKDLNHIDRADGLAPAMVEANEKTKELAVIKRKLKKVRDMNTDLDEESKTKKSRYEKAQEEYKKLYSDAEQFKVTAEDNKLANKHSQLQAQVRNLEDYIKFASNNNEKYLKNQLERNIEELYVNNMKDRENVERLEGMIDEQKAVLREMIEKEEQKNDRQTSEVIAKIKNSLDTAKFITEPVDFGDNKPKVRSLTNLQQQQKSSKKPKDLYADLPLYTPSGVKVDPLLGKKDLIKKEVNARKENARKEDRSRTPEGKPPLNPESQKPSMKPRDKDISKSPPRVEEKQKVQDSPREEKKADTEDTSASKPFSKPTFGKKKEAGDQKNENLTLGGNQGLTLGGNQNLTLGGNQGLTLGGNQNQNLTLGGNQGLTLGGNQGLTLGGNQGLTLGGNQNQNLSLGGNQGLTLGGNQNQNSKLGGNQGLTLGGNQNQNLTLGGNQGLTLGGNQTQNLTLGGNQNLTLGGSNTNAQNKAPLTLGGNKEELSLTNQQTKNQELKIGGGQQDEGEGFEIGGLSRLNRARKGPGLNNPAPVTVAQPKEELTLPGQKTTVGGGQQLTIPGTEQKNALGNQQSNDIWGNNQNQNKQPLTLGGNTTVNSNPFGGEKKEELTIKGGGRDRSHLTGNKAEEATFGVKKENPKTTFDPDDVFGGPTKVEAKPDVSNSNVSGGQLGPTGIPGVRTGRGGVAGRPRQIGQDDDFLGGGSNNTKAVPATNSNFGEQNNEPKTIGGFGGFGGANKAAGGFGGASQNEEPKAVGGFGGFGGANKAAGGFGQSEAKKETSGNTELPAEIGGKRMRMNALQSKGETAQDKAKKAEKGGGFFGDFDD